MAVPPFPLSRPRSVRVTKEMLGIQTRKSILHLDHNFFSSVHRGNDSPMEHGHAADNGVARFTVGRGGLYPPTHEAEADFYTRRDDLVKFIQRVARGHHFEAYYRR